MLAVQDHGRHYDASKAGFKMTYGNAVVSEFDKECYRIIRSNVSDFLRKSAVTYDKKGKRILDIAPQIHEGAGHYFKKATVETLDIDPKSGADYIADITKTNSQLMDGTFDIVVCTEVLEHTLDPFSAVDEIFRLLKPHGILLVTVPFNFRIHGPLPDCWRFTEHGIRELLKMFRIKSLEARETPGRELMPIHYTVVAEKI